MKGKNQEIEFVHIGELSPEEEKKRIEKIKSIIVEITTDYCIDKLKNKGKDNNNIMEWHP